MDVKAKLSPVLIINAPEWLEDAEFVEWMNNPSNPLMTWHNKGEEPTEGCDVVVFVDPGLSGDGTEEGIMPSKYWDFIVKTCQDRFTPSTGFHIVVRITFLD